MKKKNKGNNKNIMKIIKILTITLAIALISMISFVGIFKQKENKIENDVKDYSYAMDLKGARSIKLKVNTESKEIIKDADGKIIEKATDEEIQQKGYKKEEVKNNSDEVLTKENYEKVEKIIEKRMKSLEVGNYEINTNKTTGEININIPEDEKTDKIVENLNTIGKFEIIDKESNEVLIDNNNIKKADVLYNKTSSGTNIYLEIEFNKEGKKKLEDISKTYVKNENTTTNTTEENTTGEETNTTEENATNTEKEKQITMKIDDEEIMTTSFEEPITTGKIQLSVGSSSTDVDSLQKYAEQAKNISTVLDSGNLPIKYDVERNEYVLSDITENNITILKIVIAVIIVIGIILLIIKYKINGLLAGISYIGLTAIYMLIVRYTNVIISIESIFGIILTLILNYIFITMLVDKIKEKNKAKKENAINSSTKETYKEFFMRIIPICIIVIAFCFIKWIPISSFGMITFWGITIILIYNVVITRILLQIKAQE